MRNKLYVLRLPAAVAVCLFARWGCSETSQTFTLEAMASPYKELGRAVLNTTATANRATPTRTPSPGEINISFDHFVKKSDKTDATNAAQKSSATPARTPARTGELTLKDFGLDLPGPVDSSKGLDEQGTTTRAR